MKKTVSLILALMLALCCAVPAFAASGTATPDEAPAVQSLEITRLPDKLAYDDVNDLGFYMIEEDYEKLFEMENEDEINEFLASKMYLDVDLTGMELQAVYSSGASEQIDPIECNAYVVDFPASVDNPYGEYTVVVEYIDAFTEYTIDFVEGVYEDDSIYQLESITLPEKTTYVFEEDAYSDVWEFDGDVFTDWYVDVDPAGISVELYNIETGEIEVYGEDSIYCDECVYLDPDEPCGTYFVSIEVDADYDYFYDGFEIEVVSNTVAPADGPADKPDADKPASNDDNGKKPVGSADEATPDEVSAVSNKTVNTGQVFPAAVVLFIVGCGAMVTMFAYKRKARK